MNTRKRTLLCVLMMLAFIGVEYSVSELINNSADICAPWICFTVSLSIIIYGFIRLKSSIRRPQLNVFRKIFQNLVSSWLPLIIVSFFLLHLNWISNAGFDAFFGNDAFNWKSFVVAILGIASVIGSFFLYPYEQVGKPASERTLMVSGLSLPRLKTTIVPMNVDLLVKPFLDREWKGSIKKLAVIPSYNPLELSFAELDEAGKNAFFSYCGGSEFIESYNQVVKKEESVQEKLQQLIKLISGKDISVYLYESKGTVINSEPQISDLPIYDNMKECLNRIDAVLTQFEVKDGVRNTSDTLLYITPGTGVIGSALTAFSIPGDRVLLSYAQTKNKLISIALETGAHHTIQEEIFNKE